MRWVVLSHAEPSLAKPTWAELNWAKLICTVAFGFFQWLSWLQKQEGEKSKKGKSLITFLTELIIRFLGKPKIGLKICAMKNLTSWGITRTLRPPSKRYLIIFVGKQYSKWLPQWGRNIFFTTLLLLLQIGRTLFNWWVGNDN